jgi:hypothetical protein
LAKSTRSEMAYLFTVLSDWVSRYCEIYISASK